jgi:hypothetical protein
MSKLLSSQQPLRQPPRLLLRAFATREKPSIANDDNYSSWQFNTNRLFLWSGTNQFLAMTVTIQFNTADDLKLLEPMLSLFRESGVKVHVSPEMKTRNGKPSPSGIAEKLHGIISLPADFDYKSMLADELLKKHNSAG